jgi:hypothetical protein
MEEEIWKQCGESKICFYEVSNLGNVRSITKVNKKERFLKGSPDIGNYLRITINKSIFIHTLVITTFIGQKLKGLEIDHIDRNTQNNRLDNLRYCTHSENIRNRDYYRTDILEEDPKERHRIINNTKINCPCGSTTTTANKSRHEKSEKHKKYVESLF